VSSTVKPETLGIVGLGAIGGSVAWRAAAAGVGRVVGYSDIPKEGVAAVKVGAVTELAADVERVVALSDVVVLDLSPQKTLETLEQLSGIIMDRAIYCTDTAGVKGPVVTSASRLRLDRHFAGSHPLVYLPSMGFESARPDLLSGALLYVTPLPDGELAAAEIADFWHRTIGAEPVIVDPDTHDSTLAWTSHMPQVIASALAVALAKRGPRGVTYARGTVAATQPAVVDADAWTEVILENKEQILSALDSMIGETGRLLADIEAGDAKRIRMWFESGSRWRERLDG
jgi:prephenate dehydrogenase